MEGDNLAESPVEAGTCVTAADFTTTSAQLSKYIYMYIYIRRVTNILFIFWGENGPM